MSNQMYLFNTCHVIGLTEDDGTFHLLDGHGRTVGHALNSAHIYWTRKGAEEVCKLWTDLGMNCKVYSLQSYLEPVK